MTIPVVVLLGSNIDPETNVPDAVRHLRRCRGIEVVQVSACYRSAAVGGDYPDFVNAAVRGVTSLGPDELRRVLRGIEGEMGRVRTDDKNAPRTIDLDIVYYGDLVEDFGEWRIPDPDVATMAHAAVPVAEVAPDWVHPELGIATNELLLNMSDAEEKVQPIMALHLSLPHDHRHGVDIDGVFGEVYAPRYESLVRAQLAELGEDVDREGLQRTPLRVAKAMDFLTSGYTTSLDEVVNDAIFDSEGAEEMVLVKDIEFYSMCEHHMLPFFGRAAVAYLPKGKIIGLSKIARITDLFSRRLQVQERMTNQIADALIEVLEPHGVAVVIEGSHFCMMMRGVQKQGSSMITSAMRGTFKEDARTRSEFLDLVRG